MVFEWAQLHEQELIENWERARKREPLLQRPPLRRRGNVFLHVNSVQHLGGYRLLLEFDDGAAKEVDLSGELHGAVFEPLRDPDLFAQVEVNPETRTIEWPNGADLAPEYLYEIGEPVI
ncbi:MAG TPA: DUF2442 domain-containing protein [Longimicrobium sp.]